MNNPPYTRFDNSSGKSALSHGSLSQPWEPSSQDSAGPNIPGKAKRYCGNCTAMPASVFRRHIRS